MKKLFLILLLVSAACFGNVYQSMDFMLPFHTQSVLFKPTGDVSELEDVIETYNGELFPVGKTLGIYGIKFDSPADLVALGHARKVGDREIYDRELSIASRHIYEIIGALEATNKVEYAQPNYAYYVSYTPNDPYYITADDLSDTGPPNQFGLILMNADLAWEESHGDEDVVIAILDSGVDVDHPDLMDNIWVNPGEDLDGDGEVYDLEDRNGIDDDGNGYVDDLFGYDFSGGNTGDEDTDDPTEHDFNPDIHYHGNDGWGEPDPSVGDGEGGSMFMPADAGVYHGTHCAGIASAVTDNEYMFAGAGFNCSIMPVRVGHADGGMYTNNITEGIEYAVAAGADVISMSLGGFGGDDPAGTAAIQAAYEANIPVAAASGNFGSWMPVSWPASLEQTLAVGSCTSDLETSSFTQTGPELDILCPGGESDGMTGGVSEGIWSTIVYSVAMANEDPEHEPGDHSLKAEVGTSMACPHAAGLLGLIVSVMPDDATVEEIYDVVRNSATDIYSEGHDDESGYGIANFAEAVILAGEGVSEKEMPVNLSIGAVYPNPFNAAAAIEINMKEADNADLQILDLNGRVLATESHELSAGKNSISIPADGLDSGIYMVRVNTGKEVETRKMVLVK
ncbi:MAG: S8 family peptidase [Candidatus Zixiibacteriota bacterium]